MAVVLNCHAQGGLTRKAGVMAIVVSSDDVSEGDAIELALPATPHRALQPI